MEVSQMYDIYKLLFKIEIFILLIVFSIALGHYFVNLGGLRRLWLGGSTSTWLVRNVCFLGSCSLSALKMCSSHWAKNGTD